MQRTYLFVFCLFYLCFVTHQLTHTHIPPTQMFTELHCFSQSLGALSQSELN